jgi:hypothetical protein
MRTSNWKAIAEGLVAAFAALIIAASTLDDSGAQPGRVEGTIFAAATLVSVVVLQWLLWRYIVPATSTIPAQLTSLFRSKPRRGFFSGTMAFGYLHVAVYAVHLSGFEPHLDKHDTGFLVIGLCLIGLGTAARLRDVFAALSAPPERPPATT